MNKWAKSSAKLALLTAGFVALGAGISSADLEAETDGRGSILGGNQVVAPIDAAANISGNAVGLVGGSAGATADETGAAVFDDDEVDLETDGRGSILGGNQVAAPIDVAANVTGNAVSGVLSNAAATADESGAAVVHDSGDRYEDDADLELDTDGRGSIIGGNQIAAPVNAAANIAGNAVALVGGSAAATADDTGAAVLHDSGGWGGEEDVDLDTDGSGSIIGGNQIAAPIDVAANISGNAVSAVLSNAAATADETAAVVVDESGTWHRVAAPVHDSAGVLPEPAQGAVGTVSGLVSGTGLSETLPMSSPVDLHPGQNAVQTPLGGLDDLTTGLGQVAETAEVSDVAVTPQLQQEEPVTQLPTTDDLLGLLSLFGLGGV
ncbi:chaplin family protein [Allonocardiopsis opalescens]|uniref:Small secreted domain DUF320 n=1 Tax=Allonocardiopsis opalescens TaxID=1144618 RepID=A0A2T0Q2E5_9ACTN|nr:chaplin family protein [Allonocardiopsis opalescens]PRX97890.1 small secreted domain DUF320 [Allonocardiopsis opalescens]